MKLEKTKQLKTIGTAVSLALLLAVGNVNAGKPGGGNSPNKGDTFGASVGVSNVCTVVDTDDGAELVVVTTIIDKTTSKVKGGTPPDFGSDSTVQAQQKIGRGKELTPLGASVNFTPDLVNPSITKIQLCADGESLVDPSAKALNASVIVDVMNSNNSYENSQCGDDPTTDGVDESKIKLAMYDLTSLCYVPSP